METRQLHHVWTRLRPLRPRYFFIAGAAGTVVSIFALRANNLEMLRLRQAVIDADKNNGDVSRALTDLKHYVTAHMNTDLTPGDAVSPPIQLENTYNRLRAENAKQSNAAIYTEAQACCEQQNPNDYSGRSRAPCIAEYVENKGVEQKPIPQSLYKFDFVSPSWSPDLAGFSVFGTTLCFLIGITLWLVNRWFRNRTT